MKELKDLHHKDKIIITLADFDLIILDLNFLKCFLLLFLHRIKIAFFKSKKLIEFKGFVVNFCINKILIFSWDSNHNECFVS